MDLKIGDRVVMNNSYHVSSKDKGRIFTVRSAPYLCSGTMVVLLEEKTGAYAVDGLDKIADD
ncbi:MAG: hypothetical protein K2N36_07595 [Ruminiclostridium sp.]|nr:hypothetical protein [Ruminiclostridium sp.]